MYKLLLCWRYLLTRYLAFLCIISVMLGVATLIVVNSVMSGFSTKLKDRLHALLSDVEVTSTDPVAGFDLPSDEMMRRIRESPAGPHIAAMSPTIETYALLQINVNGHNYQQRVMLVGVDPKLQKAIRRFTDHIVGDPR